MALHTMAILQVYQADVLKEMDEGTGLTLEAVKELPRATDLALKATKHTARAVGSSMAGSVAAERHLGLNLTEIREKEKVFLLDAPSHNLGYLERRLALWWRNLALLKHSRLLLSSLCLGGRGTTPLPPLPCLESNP